MPHRELTHKLRHIFRRAIRLVLDLHGINLADHARVARIDPDLCSDLLLAVSSINRDLADALRVPRTRELALTRAARAAEHAEVYMQRVMDSELYGARGAAVQRQLRVIRQLLRAATSTTRPTDAWRPAP